jgi:hypothetical protein
MSVVAPLPAAGKRRRPFRRLRLAMSLPEKALYSFGIRSTKSLCLPDFLIIGAPKAGTTWLAENLDAHPQIFMGKRPWCHDPTELRYFSQDFGRPLKHYSDHFRPGQDKIKGDKSPGYCRIPLSRIRFIRRLLPSVRVILFMRNPVERAWSHAVMNLVKLKGRDVAETPPSLFYDQFARGQAYGCYTEILDRWLRVFPKEQMYTGLYDDIAGDPLRVLREVCAHIGAATDVDFSQFPYRRVVNEGKRSPMSEEYRLFLEEMYREEIVRIDERLDGRVSRWRTAAAAARAIVVTGFTLAISVAPDLIELAAWGLTAAA